MSVIHHKYRTSLLRIAAAWVDGMIFFPLGYAFDWISSNYSNQIILALSYTCYSFSFVIYSVLLHGLYGKTLGKRLCGVVVLDLSEAPLSMRQAVLRDSPCIVSLLIGVPLGLYRIYQGVDLSDSDYISLAEMIFMYISFGWVLAELITMLSNPMRRAIHDYLAGSVVVRSDEIGPSPLFN